jgi:hypothetical protein
VWISRIGPAAVLATWLCCGSPIPTPKEQQPQSNWTSSDAPCAKFDDLRKPLIGKIGVKIDTVNPWADGFRRALRFWNTVLDANFYEETNLKLAVYESSTEAPAFLAVPWRLGPNSPTGRIFEGRSPSTGRRRKK